MIFFITFGLKVIFKPIVDLKRMHGEGMENEIFPCMGAYFNTHLIKTGSP